MNTQDLLDIHWGLTLRAYELMERKNHDYAGSAGTSPFANFERSEALGLCSTGQGLLVRMSDKLSRLSEFERAGVLKVADEKVEDTCLDIINYAILYYAWKKEQVNRGKEEVTV